MGRQRKTGHGLPARMYQRGPSYYYRDRANKWHRLSRNLREALAKYSEMVELGDRQERMSALFDRYQKEIVPTKAPRTQQDNRAELIMLRRAFGAMRPREIRPKHIYAYIAARTAKVRAQRERSLLSHVLNFAISLGLLDHNPCRDVTTKNAPPRKRYVTDEEFEAVLKIASPPVKCAMLLAVITGLRQGDVLRLTWGNVTDDGLLVETQKTGRALLFEWNDSLRDTLAACKALRPDVLPMPGVRLIVSRNGTGYAQEGFKSVWQRTIRRALATGVVAERFTFHDIRAKTGSDAQDDELLGHLDTRTLRRHYQRAPRKVSPIARPSSRKSGI